jgi:hypothetical protein
MTRIVHDRVHKYAHLPRQMKNKIKTSNALQTGVIVVRSSRVSIVSSALRYYRFTNGHICKRLYPLCHR